MTMRRRGNSVDFHKQNIQQIREAQQINRERLKENESSEQRLAAQRLALREKLNVANVRAQVDTRGMPPIERRLPQSNAQDNATIEVFVHECDPSRRNYYSYDEGECVTDLIESPGRGAIKKAPLILPSRKPRTAPVDPSIPPPPPHRAGAVPEYLQKRKQEIQAVKDEIVRVARVEAEKAKYPPGRRPMTDDEQSAVLTELKAKQIDLESKLQRIPMRFDNPSLQRRRKETEDEIAQVEADIRKYSRKGVLISTEGY
jgi:hypothetical protein